MELNLAGAKEVIERTKACKPRCDRCQVVAYHGVYTVQAGRFPHIPDDELQRDIGKVFEKMLGQGWEHSPCSPSLFKRCEQCAATPEFPWASRLDAEKVLEFMRANENRAFWLGELEKTL